MAEKIEWRNGRPPSPGRYRVQDYSVTCNCCWIDAIYSSGFFRRPMPGLGWQKIIVTRWAEMNEGA